MDILKYYLGIIYYNIFPKLFGPGYEPYKNYLIKKKINNKKIKLKKYIDERIVEIPWVVSNLKKNKGNILDAGSTLNKLFIINEIKHNKKIYFTTLYPEKKYFNNYNISYTYEDLCNLSFKDKFFDIITCISTIEHIGFDNSIYNYGDFVKEKHRITPEFKTKQVLQNLKRVIKTGGQIFISVPFGKKCKFSNMRQFDLKEIRQVIDTLKPKKYSMKFYKFLNNKWQRVSEKNCKDTLPIYHKINKKKIAISSKSIVLLEATL